MKQVNTLSHHNHQKTALPGLKVYTHIRAGTEGADSSTEQTTTCQQCIQGFLAAISNGWGFFGPSQNT